MVVPAQVPEVLMQKVVVALMLLGLLQAVEFEMAQIEEVPVELMQGLQGWACLVQEQELEQELELELSPNYSQEAKGVLGSGLV